VAADSLEAVRRLLVRGLNWIGDAAMSLPTLWNLRAALPQAHLAVYAPGWSAGVYAICPAVDEVIEARKRGVLSDIADSRRLASGAFEAAIILPNSFRSALAPSLARIPGRWGYNTDNRFSLLTNAVPLPPRARKEHTVLYYKELLEAAGIPWLGEKFGLEITAATLSETEEILKQRGVREGGSRIGLAPGAAWGPSKTWPADRFASAAKRLLEDHSASVLVFGSDEETGLAEGIATAAGAGAASLAGAFPELRHLAAAISTCNLLITNDSGPLHLAAALGVPVVALFGPTDERRTGPWGLGNRSAVIARAPDCRPCYNPQCREQGHPCMEGIGVDEVVEAAGRLLAGE
jgi:heptosyltransferase-2